MSKRRKPARKTRPATRSSKGAGRQTNRRTAAPTRTRTAKIGRTLAWIGGILFVLGNIGARAGWVIFPFDRHHVFSQFGGMVVLVIGIALAGRR